ncbi:hypothetical protein AR158_C391L [Paramecium bursaria Chlorella virus AR158]|uniref:hypothetical protein n=1 Tax=Paramecium bursaria Chlorella virus AR158 TaxID=380598 RepID=UPI00015AA6B0|nr:hypothetical protein AR158_C391L [Paramecium bursaria Chlorella virus AR158]ABU43936.1 hypothetical protein AR158_C391L [Paramecium bursaria Chlorella virus AR158]
MYVVCAANVTPNCSGLPFHIKGFAFVILVLYDHITFGFTIKAHIHRTVNLSSIPPVGIGLGFVAAGENPSLSPATSNRGLPR